MTGDQALAVLEEYAGIQRHLVTRERLARMARIAAHPDHRGGDHTASDEVLAAMAALGIDR